MGDIFSIGEDGARFTVYVAMDARSTAMLVVGLFAALTLALWVFTKMK